ncbi:TPA: UMP kinase [Candidatus Poribacteria bacterium]|nr:UMP kinase [Candidatus Poribacteria bacterium]
MKERPIYKRILLELSGEMMGSKDRTIDPDVLHSLTSQISELKEYGLQIAIVIGAGNIWRGAGKQSSMSRHKADMIGMLATVVNAMALQSALESVGVPSVLLSAIKFEPIMEVEYIEPFVAKNAINYLNEGKVIIFGAGTGNPFFTTDTASALRALQIEADVVLKATKVDGVYSTDPFSDPNAKKFDTISCDQALKMGIRVMDAAAFSLCKDNNMPIVVFSLYPEGNIKKIVFGEKIGTIVTP